MELANIIAIWIQSIVFIVWWVYAFVNIKRDIKDLQKVTKKN